jgi:hypothetical protein
VSIGDIPFLPICSMPTYTAPTLALHHVDMTLPNLATPPFCPCIWTIQAFPSHFNITFTQITPVSASGSLYVLPAPPTIDRDCCEPSFDILAFLKLPCMPFSVTAVHSINLGKLSVHFGKAATCKLSLDIRISQPCLPFVVSGVPNINIGTFSFIISQIAADCKVRLRPKVSLPTTWVSVVDTVSFDGSHFKYHSKRLQVYAVQNGTSTTWATAEPCP